jgi:hypothetical protein
MQIKHPKVLKCVVKTDSFLYSRGLEGYCIQKVSFVVFQTCFFSSVRKVTVSLSCLVNCLEWWFLFTESQDNAAFLTYDPEEIVDQTLAHPGRLFHMVLENYLKVFRDMNDSCRAIHYASDADTMMSEFRVSIKSISSFPYSGQYLKTCQY